MTPLRFDQLRKGMEVLMRFEDEVCITRIVHTTGGHLANVKQVRIADGRIINSCDALFYEYDPETKTECLLEGLTPEQGGELIKK